jgi:hypothetical protein
MMKREKVEKIVTSHHGISEVQDPRHVPRFLSLLYALIRREKKSMIEGWWISH